MRLDIAILALAQAALAARRPNILFVMTDDQDLHMNSVEHMPHLQSWIVEQGATYSQHYCQVALCCPSRATLWTGRAAHNHNVTNVSPPHGGYPKVVKQGINDDNLFLWMQDAGYDTYYVGKLWNHHSVDNYNAPYARGFNGSDFLLDPYTYRYWHSRFTHNGGVPESYEGHYSTDVVSQKAQHWLNTATHHDNPFFLTVAPIATHSNWVNNPDTKQAYLLEPLVADRHKDLFSDYLIPRDPSFNAAISGGVSWIKDLPPLNDTVLAYNDHYQRQRLRSLQAVDEMVQTLVTQLEATNQLDNTYIIFTTDNGFHISQHRMHPGKECGYDTDIHIPFFLRGPSIPPGSTISSVTSHTDVASTLLSIAGVTNKELDGIAMPLLDTLAPLDQLHAQPKPQPNPNQAPLLPNPNPNPSTPSSPPRHEHATIEYWGTGVLEGIYPHPFPVGAPPSNPSTNTMQNNTYKALRLINLTGQYSLYYAVWCTNETELYDLTKDPYQVVNLLGSSSSPDPAFTIASRPLSQITTRLNALMMVLKTCRGVTCVRPWEVLHPRGDVGTLGNALEERFDGFYEGQPRMWFKGCGEAYWVGWECMDEVHVWKGEEVKGR